MTLKASVTGIGIALWLYAIPLHPTSGISTGPIADVDELSINVSLGSHLALDFASATELGLDASTAETFKQSLLARVRDHFTQAGVRVSQTEDRVLFISVYGGHFPESGSAHNFYLVEIGLQRAEEGYAGPDRTVLGTATDERLPGALLTTVLAVVDEFIEQRAQYRAIQNVPHAP
jgi:hypothetical protein